MFNTIKIIRNVSNETRLGNLQVGDFALVKENTELTCYGDVIYCYQSGTFKTSPQCINLTKPLYIPLSSDLVVERLPAGTKIQIVVN